MSHCISRTAPLRMQNVVRLIMRVCKASAAVVCSARCDIKLYDACDIPNLTNTLNVVVELSDHDGLCSSVMHLQTTSSACRIRGVVCDGLAPGTLHHHRPRFCPKQQDGLVCCNNSRQQTYFQTQGRGTW